MVNDPSTTVGDVGTNTFRAIFLPTDTATYGKINNIDVSVTVTPKQLTVSGTTAANNTYDDNTAAAMTVGNVDGILSGDDVTVTATGTFDTKEEGTNKIVSVTYALMGDDAGNYIAPVNETTTADITVPTYTVTYNNNGGFSTMFGGTATQGTAFPIAPLPHPQESSPRNGLSASQESAKNQAANKNTLRIPLAAKSSSRICYEEIYSRIIIFITVIYKA